MRQVSEETRRRMSEAAKRRCKSTKFREQVLAYWQPFCNEGDLRWDYEFKQMSQMEIARKYGVSLKRVQTSMRRYGIKPRAQIKRDQRGTNNHMWKGDRAKYAAMHYRLTNAFGQPKHCNTCYTNDPAKTYDWANLTGNYGEITDYSRMCRSCHRRYDNARRKEVQPQ